VVRSVASADETALRAPTRADVLLFPSYIGLRLPVLERLVRTAGRDVGRSGLKEVPRRRSRGRRDREITSMRWSGWMILRSGRVVQKGWARARQFTWQKTAALTARFTNHYSSREV